MGKKSPAPPPAPDYAAAATAQGQANIDAARTQARISNPNISTPLGGQRVTFGKSTFDEAGYNKAMEDYNRQLQTFQQGGEYGGATDINGNFLGGYRGTQPVAPTREQFTKTTDQDTPYIEQYLTPEAQKALEAQQRVDLALSGLGEQGIGAARDILSQRFNPNLRNLSTELGGYGQVAQGPDLMGMGQAGANVGAQRINRGPREGQYGFAQGGVQGPELQGRLDLANLPQAPVGAGITAQQAIMSRLEPQLQRKRAQLETQLTNQGLVRGGEAYNAAIQEAQQGENDLRTQAALQGIGLDQQARAQAFGEQQAAGQFANQAALSGFGANVQNQQLYNQAVQQNLQQGLSIQDAQNRAAQQMFGQRMDIQGLYNTSLAQNQNAALQQQAAANQSQAQDFNQRLQAAQFGNTALQQSLAQQLALRNQPLNEITALMSGSQVQMPQFQGYTGANVGAAPVFDAARAQGDYAQKNYQNQMAGYNNQMSGLFGLGGALAQGIGSAGGAGLFFSDRRLKSNIERVGTHNLGIGIYEYDIGGQRQRGVMADEVQAIKPEAVSTHESGYKMVNYGML
jgi:hypothetical protein